MKDSNGDLNDLGTECEETRNNMNDIIANIDPKPPDWNQECIGWINDYYYSGQDNYGHESSPLFNFTGGYCSWGNIDTQINNCSRSPPGKYSR